MNFEQLKAKAGEHPAKIAIDKCIKQTILDKELTFVDIAIIIAVLTSHIMTIIQLWEAKKAPNAEELKKTCKEMISKL